MELLKLYLSIFKCKQEKLLKCDNDARLSRFWALEYPYVDTEQNLQTKFHCKQSEILFTQQYLNSTHYQQPGVNVQFQNMFGLCKHHGKERR